MFHFLKISGRYLRTWFLEVKCLRKEDWALHAVNMTSRVIKTACDHLVTKRSVHLVEQMFGKDPMQRWE